MAQATWAVKLIDKGRTIAEHQYPGYKAMSAQRA